MGSLNAVSRLNPFTFGRHRVTLTLCPVYDPCTDRNGIIDVRMGILLSKFPEQEFPESSETTNHGSRGRSRSANRKRKTRDRETDVPAKSRKKSKSSHDADTFTHNAKSSHNDAASNSIAPVA